MQPRRGDARRLLAGGLSPASVRQAVGTLSGLFTMACGLQGRHGPHATTLTIGNVEIVTTGSSATYRRYLAGIAIDTVRSGTGSTAYVYTDHLGSLDVIASSTGALIEAMSFDVHGNRRDPIAWQLPGAIPSTTPRGFTGHEHLDTLGFIHMNGRLYDPVLGRMLQATP